MDVASFAFEDFLSDWYLRLVVQRIRINTERRVQFLPGMQCMRAILINDPDSAEEQAIDKVQPARSVRKELRCAEQRLRVGSPSFLDNGGQYGVPTLYRHTEKLLPVLAS